MTAGRLTVSTPEIDAAEQAWWRHFADIENEICWVQTPAVQRILRGNYLRHMLKMLPRQARILELGCGTGWLCRLITRMSEAEVVGTDFSEAQIAIANRESVSELAQGRLSFRCVKGDELAELGKFDAVIGHAFLHHLSTEEITAVVEDVARILPADGRFFVFEPFQSAAGTAAGPIFRLAKRNTGRLQRLATPGSRWRRTPESAEEKRLRELVAERDSKMPPRGPSPKEIAFVPGELEALLETRFTIASRRRCMIFAHLAVQEFLLFGKSSSLPMGPIVRGVAHLARFFDQLILRENRIPPGAWIFEILECRPRRS